MLNEEEAKLNAIIRHVESEIKDCGRQDTESNYIFLAEINWLAEKLKETNEECSAVTLELQETNEELARFREHYEG